MLDDAYPRGEHSLTVAQLIEKLKDEDPEAIVYTRDVTYGLDAAELVVKLSDSPHSAILIY